jgi:serine O-acetyltransferase
MSFVFRQCRLFLDALRILQTLPHILIWVISPARPYMARDRDRWHSEWGHLPERGLLARWRLVGLLIRFPEFRNLFYYRTERSPHLPSRLLLSLARWLLPPRDSLFFYTPEIGPGLFIEHGFSTIIAADRIGKDCWINQQVTIGYSNKKDCPTIGDRVRIAAGAKVFGKVFVGDDVLIGANAVVCKDVPPNCTVVGVPARIIRREGKRVDEKL